VLLGELLAQPRAAAWPPPAVARTIEVRRGELAARRGGGTSLPVPSCLLLHAQALLDAGLTDAMITQAVVRGDT
jgi:hypothetical protein